MPLSARAWTCSQFQVCLSFAEHSRLPTANKMATSVSYSMLHLSSLPFSSNHTTPTADRQRLDTRKDKVGGASAVSCDRDEIFQFPVICREKSITSISLTRLRDSRLVVEHATDCWGFGAHEAIASQMQGGQLVEDLAHGQDIRKPSLLAF